MTKRLTEQQALKYWESDLLLLAHYAHEVRLEKNPGNKVTFVVDRNINYTNICISRCKFCAFFRPGGHKEAYVLNYETIKKKIKELAQQNGTQLLIQGGLNPDIKLDYYVSLFKNIKKDFKNINIHSLSPPEIDFISKNEKLSVKEVLITLKQAGLDSLPGGGAEILVDRVRQIMSPNKTDSDTWLKIMESAHEIGMKTTATMVFGGIETLEERLEHLFKIRDLQDKTGGFTAFIPWTLQTKNTVLEKIPLNLHLSSHLTLPSPPAGEGKMGEKEINTISQNIQKVTGIEYLKMLALSRLVLDNIPHIQVSYVTQGAKLAQIGLFWGADDFGGTMLEENVVRACDVDFKLTKEEIIQNIKSAGFIPVQRDTYYNKLIVLS